MTVGGIMVRYYSKKELTQLLKDKAEALGRLPMPEDFNANESKAVLSYYKKWSKALKHAGITDKTINTSKPAAQEKIKTESAPKPAEKKTVQKDAPKEKAPSKPEESVVEKESKPSGSRRYSKSIITKMLLDEVQRLGKKPTRKEIDENKNLPTVSTCLRYFNTTKMTDVWNEILN